jgi:hypothetical protein
MEQEFFDNIEKNPIIGIFGDTVFPNKSIGEGIREKSKVISELKSLLLKMDPKKVYIIPHRGVNLTSLTILQYLNIPYTIVNPYRGYFNSTHNRDKLKIVFGMENSSSVITVGKNPKNARGTLKALSDTEDFVIDRSDLIISINGNKPDNKSMNLLKKLPESGKHIIFFKY